MKQKLSFKELTAVASMLFGMFFGAGNLIFPAHMGQLAGSNVYQAVLGFILTGVGLPLLGVVVMGASRSSNLQELGSRVGKRYSTFFTCALYLTIGPLFAIPRCATVSYTVGVAPMFSGGNETLYLAIFSLLFFFAVLWFSLRPGKILTWIGRVINPVFLVFLGALVVTALIRPMAPVSSITPDVSYASGAFYNGFLEGYNTMDAIAGLAFGVVVIDVVRRLGVEEPGAIARNTARAGIFSCLIMAGIYVAIAVVGAQSRGNFPLSENGGIALSDVAHYYFGSVGTVILAITVTAACLKTAIGLVTSCSEMFAAMFPKSPGYRFWAITFSTVSLLIANIGLTAIIEYAVPVLMFLYPLTITLILLGLFGRFYDNDRIVNISVTAFTLSAAVFDLIRTLPLPLRSAAHLDGAVEFAQRVLPFFDRGLGWLCPAATGFVLGLLLRYLRKLLRRA